MTAGGARYDVVVIGAGANGLAAAALLAKAGRGVLVLERSAEVGGLAAGSMFHPGYRGGGMLQDTALLRPDVCASLELERHGLALARGPHAVFAPDADGPGLLLAHDPVDAAEELAAVSPRDAEQYAGYRSFLGRVAGVARRLIDQAPPDVPPASAGAWLALGRDAMAIRRLGRRDMMELLRLGPMCVSDWLGEWFETERLKCMLAVRAVAGTFMGPRSPGSNANLFRREIACARSAVGGAAAVIDALADAARRYGATVRTSAAVEGLRVDVGGIAGVTLEGGETIDAGVVAASCDPRQTFLRLLEPGAVPHRLRDHIESYRMRGTTARIDLALSTPLRFAGRPELEVEHAVIGDSLDVLEQAFDAVKYGELPRDPVLELHVPSVADPSCAPEGASVASMLVHFVPYAIDGGWDDAARDALAEIVVRTLARYAPDVADSIVARDVLAPPDVERRYGVTGGHVHHGEHALDQLVVRPCPECARYRTPVPGLFLCGAGSHPGGGLTGAPGPALAAAMILAS